MDLSQKKLLLIAVVFLIVVFGVWIFLSPSPAERGSGAFSKLVGKAPAFSDAERLGKETPSEAKQAAAAAYKKILLAKARSGAAFSAEEKAAIGKLMLTEAHLYNFFDDERTDIFSALRRQ